MDFTDKFLPGKANPCDYRSRKPTNISDCSRYTRDKMDIDDKSEILVMKAVMDDMPQALSLEEVKKAAREDSTLTAIQSSQGRD